jgi:hypothetical protein
MLYLSPEGILLIELNLAIETPNTKSQNPNK